MHAFLTIINIYICRDYFNQYAASSLRQLTIVKRPYDKREFLTQIVTILAPDQVSTFGMPGTMSCHCIFIPKPTWISFFVS